VIKAGRFYKQFVHYEQLNPIADAIGSGKDISVEMLLNRASER